MKALKPNLVLFAATLAAGLALVMVAPSTAAAGAGDPNEWKDYRDYLRATDLQCPQGSVRTIESDKEGTIETCQDKNGNRVGYFLHWNANDTAWTQLGRYTHGKRDGRWVEFSSKGTVEQVTYYRRGRKTRAVNIALAATGHE